MRKGVYDSTTLRRIRLVPCVYRCPDCWALNIGFYPVDLSAAARDHAAEILTHNGRELTEAERTDRGQRQTAAAVEEAREQMASRNWSGSPNAVALCGRCGTKARWSRPGMRIADWAVSLFIPLGIGVYEIAYEGYYCHEPRATLFGSILVALAALLMLTAAVITGRRRRRVRALSQEALPSIFSTAEELEAALSERRRGDEPLYRFIDPRSPEADFLKEQNAAAPDAAAEEAWVLCRNCLRTLTPALARTYNGRTYCPDCYGLVRQEAEARSYLNRHRKRGGEIM